MISFVSPWFAPGFAALAVAWLVVILVAPALWVPVAGIVYAAGSLICHQIAERSFHLDGTQLPVCARCFGIYGGAALGSIAGASTIARSFDRSRRLTWTALAAVPTLATGVLEWGLGWPVSNVVRAVAALPLGFAVSFVVVSAVATLHYE
jgi:uncharacterized membrane protein